MDEEELISIRLPNGNLITDVPAGATQSEVKDRAISLGLADISDFVIDPVVSLTNKKEEEQEFEILEYLRGNLDLPAGIAGSLVGAGLGVPAGPVGMFLGATALGGAGTFAGSLASDELTGEDLDYNEALNQALTSMGFDVATAGIAKLLRPFYRPGVAAIQKKLGFTVEETAKQIANNLPAPGTKESLQASQKILSKEKLSLTPFQANAQGLSVLNERLARGGLLSGGIMDTNMSAVNKATQDAIQEITNRYVTNIDGSPGEIAEVLFDVISQGKKALSNNYGAALDEIILDGKNISNCLPYWYSLIGYVSQSPFLVDDTILANITLGVDKKEIDQKKIEKVLELSQLNHSIKNFHDGIDTVVGEDGKKLSGGQKQKISIARALYKNSEILILDEPTSAMDAESEMNFIKSFLSKNMNKTIIIITHEEDLFKYCDDIYEVQNHKIIKINQKKS